MIDDLVLDDDGTEPEKLPGLVVPAQSNPAELLVLERMHRFADSLAVKLILFVDEAGNLENARQWQTPMSWPVLPTMDEALAFKHHEEMKLLDAYWDELQRARAAAP